MTTDLLTFHRHWLGSALGYLEIEDDEITILTVYQIFCTEYNATQSNAEKNPTVKLLKTP